MRFLLFLLAFALPLSASAQHDDIVDIAAGNDNFQTLVAAVQAAGLVDVLKGDGPFTVFAPTNDAFARLGDDAIQQLLRPENRDQLTAILTYHVVPGRYTAGDIYNLDELETVNGESLSLGVRVDDAELISTDIRASNGIIHVIDRVLMPRQMPASRGSHH
ncbi:fasciclin domain-containing protein [Rubrivirga sp. IMCC43871]|uniref:fasciclin domain-containing protein n=1 Tax=Rubrivirga sp. IMCC43871 TaxID=3391575 RepID=UPI00398FDB4A